MESYGLGKQTALRFYGASPNETSAFGANPLANLIGGEGGCVSLQKYTKLSILGRKPKFGSLPIPKLKPLPIGISDFKELIDGGYVYVDKTLFIQEILEKGTKVALIPRMRRFGKTLNLSMLHSFFEKGRKDYSGPLGPDSFLSETCLLHGSFVCLNSFLY